MNKLSQYWFTKEMTPHRNSQIPAYLEDVYWWAYVHPNAVAIFERQWIINLILWGNFKRLRDAALNALGARIPGRTLQIACVYGDFSVKLAERIEENASLDIVDVLPIQLDNLKHKLSPEHTVRIMQRDSTRLMLPNESYDQAVIFFLLHEQPASVRAETLAEVVRVLKPNGKLVIVDYHRPLPSNPLRYFFKPILNHLEPFAVDLWNHNLESWFPKWFTPRETHKETFFGSLYQMMVIRK